MAESNHRDAGKPFAHNQDKGAPDKAKKASPEEEVQHDPTMLETFEDAGAGVAAKE